MGVVVDDDGGAGGAGGAGGVGVVDSDVRLRLGFVSVGGRG